MYSKGNNKYLILKVITIIDPLVGFEIMQYEEKHTINIDALVETTWPTRHPSQHKLCMIMDQNLFSKVQKLPHSEEIWN